MGSERDSVRDKVLEYENFLNDVLKRDLNSVLKSLDCVQKECVEYMNLKLIIENVLDNNITHNLKTKYDIGCNFYMDAVIHDTSMIFLRVGLGVFVEYTLPEALDFIDSHVKRLEERCERLDKRIVELRAQIKVTMEALREVQGIPQLHTPRKVVDF